MVSISVSWQFVWGDVFTFPHSLYLHFTELLGQGYRSHTYLRFADGQYVMAFSNEAHIKPSICIRKLTNYSCNSCTEHPIHFQSEQEESQWIAYPSSYDSHMLIKYVSTVAIYGWTCLSLGKSLWVPFCRRLSWWHQWFFSWQWAERVIH